MPEESPPPRWQTLFDAYRNDLARGVEWLLVGRVALVLISLAVLLIYEQGWPRIFPGAYVVLVVALAVSVGYLVAYRRVTDLEQFVLVQIALDLAIETFLVYLTGGVYNVGFGFLYFASILSASLLLSEGAGIALATISTAAIGLVALVYWLSSEFRFTPPLLSSHLLQNVDVRWGAIVSNVLLAGTGFHLVAGLAALLPYRMTRVKILYDEILDAMREGLVAVDNVGKIVFVNREAKRLLNWEGIGRMVGRRFPDLLRRKEDRRILELLTADTNLHEEIELEMRDKGPVAVEVKTAILKDARGRVRGVIGVFNDATFQRRVAEMETRLARLEGTEEMALGIAHEIRNPLASIRGAVQELARGVDASRSDDDRKLADIVTRESDRLDKIVAEFLAFARTRPPERFPHDVAKLVEETVLLLASRDDARSVEVRPNVLGGPFVAPLDQGQLRQVLLNVGINALEAMKRADPLTPGSMSRRGTPTPTPSSGTPRPRPAKPSLVFTVQSAELPARSTLPGGGRLLAARQGVEVLIDDDGPGIPPEMRERVFLPFFTTKKSGLGLGLAIAQKIVRDHGGDIACELSPSGGGRFRIALPLVETGWRRPISGTTRRAHRLVDEPQAPRGGEPLAAPAPPAEPVPALAPLPVSGKGGETA